MNVPKLGLSTAIELSRTEQTHYRALISTLAGYLDTESRSKYLKEASKDVSELVEWIDRINGIKPQVNSKPTTKSKSRNL